MIAIVPPGLRRLRDRRRRPESAVRFPCEYGSGPCRRHICRCSHRWSVGSRQLSHGARIRRLLRTSELESQISQRTWTGSDSISSVPFAQAVRLRPAGRRGAPDRVPRRRVGPCVVLCGRCDWRCVRRPRPGPVATRTGGLRVHALACSIAEAIWSNNSQVRLASAAVML